MAHPATRVLALLELLQGHHQLTGAQLAERLGVDVRSVRRYAAQLRELGIPVRTERGPYGGYRLAPGYKLPPLMFSNAEAVAVLLGLLASGRLGLTTDAPAAASALAKIDRVLPLALRGHLAAVRDALSFTEAPRAGHAPQVPVLLALAEAVAGNVRVRMAYRSWRGVDSERVVDPYGLVFHHGRWYTVGFDHRRAALRTFRLDRITQVTAQPGRFDRPEGFDPVAHVVAALAAVPYAWEVEVLVEAPLAELAAWVPPATATLSATEGGVLLRARAERLDGMARLLAGLAWPFTVRAPAELRTELAALGARLIAAAGV